MSFQLIQFRIVFLNGPPKKVKLGVLAGQRRTGTVRHNQRSTSRSRSPPLPAFEVGICMDQGALGPPMDEIPQPGLIAMPWWGETPMVLRYQCHVSSSNWRSSWDM